MQYGGVLNLPQQRLCTELAILVAVLAVLDPQVELVMTEL